MIDIKDTFGNVRFSTEINEGSKRKFLLMKEDYITLKFSLEEPVNFKLGDYVDDPRFGLFELCDLYKPTYNSSNGGYDFELRLDAYYWKWKNKLFKYMPEAARQEASWNLTATLEVHADAFLRGLTALGYTYKGTPFECVIDKSVDASAKLVSYDNMNMLDALFKMAETWECECWVTENVIHFGRCEYHTAVDMEMGVNVAEMTASNSQGTYATRIYAFGSTRNLPAGYRPVAEEAVVNGVVQKRLMLPADTPFIDAYPGLSAEEAIESVVVFDDVYPRNEGTMSDVTTKEYTDSIENADGTVTEEKWNAFRFKDAGLTFSKEYILPGEELHIIFQSGVLNGMDFAVRFDPDNKDEQLWEIVRNEDYGRKLPDEVLAPKSGDKYVLYGWDATRIDALGLVAAAEQELKARAIAYTEKVKIDPSTYSVKMISNSIYSADGVNKLLEIGDRVKLINGAYWEEGRQSRVIGYEYNLDFPYDSPVYTVGETAPYSKIGELEGKVESLTYKGQSYIGSAGRGVYLIRTNDSTPATDSNALSAKRTLNEISQKALSRLGDDAAAGIITFIKGLLVGKNKQGITTSDSGVVTAVLDELKNVFTIVSPDFVSGDLGNGFTLKYDQESGRSYLEVDELLVRKLAYFVELVIKQLRHVGGEILLTPASMKCIKVEEVNGAYRCFFEQDDGGRSLKQEFVVGDQVRAQTFNIKEGTSHNVSNKYYWRLVTAVGDDYIDLSKTDCDTGSGKPEAGDDIVQLGNRDNAARQNAIILSTVGDDAPSFKQYKGIDSYSLKGKEISVISATLNKLVGEFISVATGKSYDDMFDAMQTDLDLIKEQTDKEYTLWFFDYDPSLVNIPASDWVTDELKLMHEQDMFYNRLTGFAYRFEKSGDSWGWNNITDQQTVKALENAAKAQDTADGKRRVFVIQPTNAQAYDVGDLWTNATIGSYENDTLVCKTAKAGGKAFSIEHWKPASNATTAYIENLGDSIRQIVTTNKENADKAIKNAQEVADKVARDLGETQKNVSEQTTVINQTKEKVEIIAANFNADGSVNESSGLLTKADGSTLYASKNLEDGNKLIGYINQTATTTTISASKINITGAVSFSSFTADLQGTINGKASSDSVRELSTKVDSKYGKSDVDSAINAYNATLGGLAHKDAVEKAMLGNTLISGAYIKTELIDVDNLYVKHLNGATGDFTGTVTATDGKVGGMKIKENSLTNEGFNNDAYIILRNDKNKTFAGIGGSMLPATAGGVQAVARFENNRLISNTDNIALYCEAGGASGVGKNYALWVAKGQVWMPGVLFGGTIHWPASNQEIQILSKYNFEMVGSVSATGHSSSGYIQINHNLGHTNYLVIACAYGNYTLFTSVADKTATDFKIYAYGREGGAAWNKPVSFVVIGMNSK